MKLITQSQSGEQGVPVTIEQNWFELPKKERQKTYRNLFVGGGGVVVKLSEADIQEMDDRRIIGGDRVKYYTDRYGVKSVCLESPRKGEPSQTGYDNWPLIRGYQGDDDKTGWQLNIGGISTRELSEWLIDEKPKPIDIFEEVKRRPIKCQ